MARKSNLAAMSVEDLLKLRDDVGSVLSRKAQELEDQLSKLGQSVTRVRGSPMKGRKVAVKYRDDAGNTWAGRGAQQSGYEKDSRLEQSCRISQLASSLQGNGKRLLVGNRAAVKGSASAAEPRSEIGSARRSARCDRNPPFRCCH
jgi:hypothetical protein